MIVLLNFQKIDTIFLNFLMLNKRYFIFNLLFLCFASNIFPQGGNVKVEYYILQVKGKVYNHNKNKLLEAEDLITSKTKLSFQEKNAIVFLLNTSNQHRFVLRANSSTRKINVDDLIQVCYRMKDSRSGDVFITEIPSLTKFFKQDTFVVLGKTQTLSLSKKNYPIQDAKMLVKYTYQHQEISREIRSDDNNFVLNYDEIFKSEETYIPQEEVTDFRIEYEAPNKQEITKFKLYFLLEDKLKELRNLKKNVIKYYGQEYPSEEEQIDKFYECIVDFYGYVDEEAVDKFFKNKDE